jgi:hypothetical protein
MAARRAVERGSGVAWSSSAPTGCIDKLEPISPVCKRELAFMAAPMILDEGIIVILEKKLMTLMTRMA